MAHQRLGHRVQHAVRAFTPRDARALAAVVETFPVTAHYELAETLRSWLLHHGRREEIAAELFVHPQTVRYRMGQLREAYGDRLDDPATVLALTVALGVAD